MTPTYDIFISYRRDAFEPANLFATRLKALGYRVFFDIETMNAGKFNDRSLDAILDKRWNRVVLAREYTAPIATAIDEAEEITLWEKISNSNYRDIDHLNSLVKAYANDLLAHITRDFMEDVK